MKSDLLYLSDIQDCIQRIESYTIEGKVKFLKTPIIRDAVICNFEIIGEATKRLSPLKDAYADVAWKQIAGLRDILIHDYLKVNLNRVWGIIEQDLPQLKQTVEALHQRPEQ
jgi:uncharacterized protein with HEPN domain